MTQYNFRTLTKNRLREMAKRGEIPINIMYTDREDNLFDFLCFEDHCVEFHNGCRVILTRADSRSKIPLPAIHSLINLFKGVYSGYHLEFEKADDRGLCDNDREEYFTFVIKKSEKEDLTISDDYKLVIEKMGEIKEIRSLVNEAKEMQKTSAERLNLLFRQVNELRKYGNDLKLDQERQEKYKQRLNDFNDEVRELELRLKKDIPELDKNLDINNYRL